MGGSLVIQQTGSIEDVLHRLVVEQIREQESADFKLIPLGTRKEVFKDFKKSERFKQAYRGAVRYHLVPRTEDELLENRKDFVGRLYQDLAYLVFASKQTGFSVLLSQERTSEFYKTLYPDAKEVQWPYGITSLQGISVPDGLLVEEHDGDKSILAVVEYTLTGSSHYLEEKFHAVCIAKDRFPTLFSDASLLFVMPKNRVMPRILKRGDIELQELPFTHLQFRDFIDGVYEFYRSSGESATLKEFQEEALAQFERSKGHLRDGQPTPEHLLYLSKFSEIRL